MPRTVFFFFKFSGSLKNSLGESWSVWGGGGEEGNLPLDPAVCWQCTYGHVCHTKVQTDHIFCFFLWMPCRYSWEDLPHLVRFTIK